MGFKQESPDSIHILKISLGAMWGTDCRETGEAAGRPGGGLPPKSRQQMMGTVALTVTELEESERDVCT